MADQAHIPVMLKECIDALNIRGDGIYVDGTLGRAGHSAEIARRLTTGRLIGVDRDQAALDAAPGVLSPWMERVTLVHNNFCEIPAVLDELGVELADGVLLDLGVSSPQLDDPARGFSYMKDAPLDMRMDQTQALTAREAVNSWDESHLFWVFARFGEERYAHQVAAAVVRAREQAPIETTFQLVDVIKSAMPAAALREKQHPAKRCFQALRIAVNDELTAVSDAIDRIIPRLRPGGRFCVITFHSLEDRLVKIGFNTHAQGCICPPDFPVCVCGRKPKIKILTKKPLLPTEKEITENPRSRSAKLRICEKLP